ncbi:hypothetical protein Y10_16520 [Neptunitalea sp. Y10]|uniref:Uncharacterized protein n=1 Tax=Neptunitalea lumnitzerae TaxID=2965509 RepID=A0ABQ5MIR7_9FLAO|nr:hypothetical protein Y10_16520 [Neptunitalea sp. Y10]
MFFVKNEYFAEKKRVEVRNLSTTNLFFLSKILNISKMIQDRFKRTNGYSVIVSSIFTGS